MESGCSAFQLRVMMKMSAVSTITVLLLCCSALASTDPQGGCDYHVATNDSFSVPLQPPQAALYTLRWKYNNELIFRSSGDKVIIGKKEDVDRNGFLKLKNVGKSQEGTYTPEVYDEIGDSVKDLKSIRLCVMGRVLKPTVTFVCSSPVKFTCNVDQAKDLTFQWLQNNEVLKEAKERTLTRSLKELETATLSCNVSNPASFAISDAVKHDCKAPGFVFPERIWGINTWILVGGGGGIVLLLIVMVIVCCVQNRRKKRLQLKDEEELRLEWTNPNQQQHHHHHNHNHPPDQHHHHHHHHHQQQQQQPAGHTGPRQHRSKQQRGQQRPRAPDHPNGHPQPSPRRPAQVPKPAEKGDDEQPPPLPQPRKKAPKTPRV